MANDDDPSGFEEAQAPFATAGVDMAAIYDAFGYRCPFTGVSLRAEAAADPLGSLLRLAVEAPVAAGNVLPASMAAIHAYERGHLAIGPHSEFLVALDRIDPEFLERLNAIGRLSLPADPQFHPNAALLKIHREEFAEGFIE